MSITKIKVKKVCFQCGYFNKQFGKKRYKCAGSSCPGVNWSDKKKKKVLDKVDITV